MKQPDFSSTFFQIVSFLMHGSGAYGWKGEEINKGESTKD